MRVIKEVIWSFITQATPAEMKQLKGLLDKFDDDDEEGPIEPLFTIADHDTKVYTGLLPFLEECGMKIEIASGDAEKKERAIEVEPTALNRITLRDYQIMATRKTLLLPRGTIQAPTGSGKTEMMGSTIAHYRQQGLAETALVLVPSGFIMEQTANRFERYGLGDVGRIGYGHKFKPGRAINVCIVDSAYRLVMSEPPEFIYQPDMLFLDEAHHAKAKMWATVCRECLAPNRWAFTATVHDDPKQFSRSDLLLFGLVGPMIFEIRSKELRTRGYLANPHVTMIKPDSGQIPIWSWLGVYKAGIVGNKIRNSLICTIADSCYKGGYKSLIFVGRKEHGHKLCQMLAHLGDESIFVHGGATVWVYKPSGSVRPERWSIDDVAAYVNERKHAIIVSTQVLDEGVDIPIINVLIMGTGMKKYRRTVQRAGRGMRPKGGDNRVFIFDFWDENHLFLSRQSEYRMWTYQEEEYEISGSLEETEQLMGIKLNLDTKLFYKVKLKKQKETAQ